MTGGVFDEAATVLAALPWEPPTARQVTEAAARHGWLPDPPWLTPVVPAALKGHADAAAEER